MLTIRPATRADIPLIQEITARTWPQTYTPILGEEQVAYMLRTMYSTAALQHQMDSGHHFLIGYSAGMPVGFASYSLHEPRTYKLHKLYILPENRGTGAGRALMAHIINEIKLLGASALVLNVNRYNHSAFSFYQRGGFTVIGEEDIDIGGGYFMNDYVLQYTF
ncbi:MAG: GNAT family N-acetyltransferase [Taibaiella sp.]|nr:GNAT family N-acetyltransferase [Taibaiella sp.]